MTANDHSSGRRRRTVLWLPGLVVALGAAVATAHGLFEVAAAARVPAGIAWLYPLITDGLALVAYTATARLRGRAARYAWAVVVVAAGLSGLAQAAYLAGGPTDVAPALRFGVGAWPAIAAAVVAHLLYLLAAPEDCDPTTTHGVAGPAAGVQPSVQFQAVQPAVQAAVQPALFTADGVQSDDCPEDERPVHEQPPRPRASSRSLPSPARERAESLAVRHAQRHGAWPTVSQLEATASVARGTASAVLQTLRDQPLPIHLASTTDTDTEHEEQQ